MFLTHTHTYKNKRFTIKKKRLKANQNKNIKYNVTKKTNKINDLKTATPKTEISFYIYASIPTPKGYF